MQKSVQSAIQVIFLDSFISILKFIGFPIQNERFIYYLYYLQVVINGVVI